MIHACGMVDLVDDLAFSPDVGAAAARRRCGPARRSWPTRRWSPTASPAAGLPADNEVICTLGDPDVPERAAAGGHHPVGRRGRPRGSPHLDGAVVAIGNAPTALFRLLELLADGRARARRRSSASPSASSAPSSRSWRSPSTDHGVPWLTVHGRRGGSAMAAAAVNALASERE